MSTQECEGRVNYPYLTGQIGAGRDDLEGGRLAVNYLRFSRRVIWVGYFASSGVVSKNYCSVNVRSHCDYDFLPYTNIYGLGSESCSSGLICSK